MYDSSETCKVTYTKHVFKLPRIRCAKCGRFIACNEASMLFIMKDLPVYNEHYYLCRRCRKC